jgi:hypothetical protein
MADPAASAALLPAAAEPRIEQLEHLGVHLGEREVAEGGPNVGLDLGPVAVSGAGLDVGDLQPPVQQHADGGLGARLSALVDLVQQPGADPLGLPGVCGRLSEVVVPAREGIDARVDPYAERPARQLFDAAPGPLPSALAGWRGVRLRRFHATNHAMAKIPERRLCWWAPWDSNPQPAD